MTAVGLRKTHRLRPRVGQDQQNYVQDKIFALSNRATALPPTVFLASNSFDSASTIGQCVCPDSTLHHSRSMCPLQTTGGLENSSTRPGRRFVGSSELAYSVHHSSIPLKRARRWVFSSSIFAALPRHTTNWRIL